MRKAARIAFPGTPGTVTAIVGDVELRVPPAERVFMDRRQHGTFAVLSLSRAGIGKTRHGTARLFTLLHATRPILLELGGTNAPTIVAADWMGRVDHVNAVAQDNRMPSALLIRPDGYAAWAASSDGDIDVSALQTALITWFGPAQTSRGDDEMRRLDAQLTQLAQLAQLAEQMPELGDTSF